MNSARFLGGCTVVWLAATALAVPSRLPAAENAPNVLAFEDPTGQVRTYDVNGRFDRSNPFFQPLGTNGRACITCHQPSDAMGITPAHLKERFDATDGRDPIFRTNDGSNSPFANVSTVKARRAAYSMLLSKGLIRVGIAVPPTAEFELVDVDDPYGYASATELSLFRRPLPSTNLNFLATVMWDGRETFAGQSIHFDLSDQSNTATLTHAAGINPLTDAEREAIVSFELGLFTAQTVDHAAGNLHADGALGGPVTLSAQPFFIGINDVLGPTFNPRVFTLFNAWANLKGPDRGRDDDRCDDDHGRDNSHGRDNDCDRDRDGDHDSSETRARESIARGQEIFNTRPITISGVRGLNDVLGVPSLAGTCTTCHDSPNAGDHSVGLPLDIGLTDESRRTPDMPLYTFRNKTTGATLKTTDPGRGLITGKWSQLSLFKGPILRGLSARAPYFHNGFAATLDEAVDFYNTRFGLALTARERADLIAFLHAL